MSKPPELNAQDFLRRACSGRWPLWRPLALQRKDSILYVAVEWRRIKSGDRYSLVALALDALAVHWNDFPTAAAALDALAALDADRPPPSTPTAPAVAEGGAP